MMQYRAASVPLFLLLVLLTNAAFAQPRFDFATTPGGLSKDVVPTHYRLSLDLDPHKESFSGSVAIMVRIARAVSSLAIHAHELTSRSAVLTSANGRAQSLSVQPGKLPAIVAAVGKRWICHRSRRIRAAHRVQRQGSGYRLRTVSSVPYTARGQPVVMLATQLEAVFARMVFPCFDEPAFRAVFEISVTAPSTYAAHSNMPRVDFKRLESQRRPHRTSLRANAFNADLPSCNHCRSIWQR